MRELAGILVLCALVALAPQFISSGVTLNLIIMTLYAALLGQAWNILGGFGGQFSFGHAVFFGSGAYAMAVLQVKFGWNAWAALAAARGARKIRARRGELLRALDESHALNRARPLRTARGRKCRHAADSVRGHGLIDSVRTKVNDGLARNGHGQ